MSSKIVKGGNQWMNRQPNSQDDSQDGSLACRCDLEPLSATTGSLPFQIVPVPAVWNRSVRSRG